MEEKAKRKRVAKIKRLPWSIGLLRSLPFRLPAIRYAKIRQLVRHYQRHDRADEVRNSIRVKRGSVGSTLLAGSAMFILACATL